MTEHFITLSTTEPNNNIGIVKLRHADVNSQAIVAQIVENGQPKSFEGLQPFFCLMAQEVTGQGVSEESVVSFDAKNGTLKYIASDNALQFVGRNEAYFSFRKQSGDAWTEQFSTRSFYYVVEKSVYSQPFKDSNYFWTFKELFEKFVQYQNQGKESWEDFVNQNRGIIESIDPGGKLLSEIVTARKNSSTLNDRLNQDFGNVNAQLAQNKLHSVSWLNAIEYGFKNDGVSLNDDIMDHYINNDSDKKLYVPSGVYIFSRNINFPDKCYLELDAKAEFKLETKDIQDYFITIRKGSTRNDYSIGSFIKGGELNANFCAKNGVGFYKNRHTIFESSVVRNVLEKGVVTRTDRIPDGQIHARDILIENDHGIAGSFGFYDNAFDTRAEGIEVVNFESGYYTVAGRFDNINAWIKDSTILKNSIFATIDGYDITFSNVSVDTYRKGFQITTREYSASITNMLWITNESVYTTELQNTFNRIIFNAEYPDRHFKVSGLKIDKTLNLSLSNIKLPKSSFLNVTTPKIVDPYASIINFRNDNDKLQQLGNYIGNPKPLNLNKSTNFDLVTENGLYETNLYIGAGGVNAPNVDTGILEVSNINVNDNNLIVQKLYGIKYFGYRIFIANAWQPWAYFAKT
ncbi:BppU family phage baseplate upper protein [Lactococcus lactis]|uniref:BppU family phage baseplate upper protein n=1 Tax=Lactococcus lactis TaxID=1358 RepID=UPI0021B0BCBE|nr:BppU family phage baseplate upper protein [Lactococcus lactis]